MNILKKIPYWLITPINDQVKKTWWYRNQLDNSNRYPTNSWYRLNLDRNYEMACIGSSNAYYAYKFSDSDVKGMNWADKPRSLELSFKILKNFFSIIKKDGIIIISLGPFSGIKAPWSGNKEEDRLYGILAPELFTDFRQTSRRMSFPIIAHPKTSIIKLIKDDHKADRYEIKQLKSKEEYLSDADKWITLWKREFGIESLECEIPMHLHSSLSERENLMVEIIKFCKERDLNPIVILPPVHQALSHHFTQTFKDRYLESILKISEQNGATIIDMLNDEGYEDDDFYNSFFLNPKGSRKFMENLNKRIHNL